MLWYGSIIQLENTRFSPYMQLWMTGGLDKFSLLWCGKSQSPLLHVFLWLLANNKVLTRDNLAKRKQADDKTCLFCDEFEFVLHLFFECCVAQLLWKTVSEISALPLIKDFESLDMIWVRRKKFRVHNVLTSAVIWSIWKTRNNLCFQVRCGPKWRLC
jgi:hypothetical protein